MLNESTLSHRLPERQIRRHLNPDVRQDLALLAEQSAQVALIDRLEIAHNQVFMNPLVNVAHTIDVQGESGWCTGAEGQAVGGNIREGISDSGCTMPVRLLNWIFVPNFTAKPVGKDAGLGLSISYGIVKKHGGRIDANRRVGTGTVFRITLPINSMAIEENNHG